MFFEVPNLEDYFLQWQFAVERHSCDSSQDCRRCGSSQVKTRDFFSRLRRKEGAKNTLSVKATDART